MTDTVRFPLVLGMITVCSALGLAVSYRVTYERIRFQEELKKARGLCGVFGVELDEATFRDPTAQRPWRQFAYGGLEGKPPKPFVVYRAAVEGKQLYAAEGRGQGYSSKVQVVVAVEGGRGAEGPRIEHVKAIKVVKQLETPGLGSKCEDPAFQRQFERLPEDKLDLRPGGDDYRKPDEPGSKETPAAISGATITSNAVLDAIRQALDRVRHHLARGPHDG